MSIPKEDLYQLLGVAKDASAEQLKKAYRQSALKYHPDRNPGDKHAEEKFKEVTTAYQILSDPQKRQLYDQYGRSAFEGGAGQGPSGFGNFSGGDFSDIFEGIFEDFFAGGGGSGRKRTGPQRGADLECDTHISFEEAVFGCEKDLSVERHESCVTCHGSGAREGTTAKKCGRCQGSGQVISSSGFFSLARTCPACSGHGMTIEHPCKACKGHGLVLKSRVLKLKIPAGVDDHMRLRMTGEGQPGQRQGPAGDLYVNLHVQAHDIFTRRENDLLCEVKVPMTLAALGGQMEIPTLKASTSLKIPAGTQTGKVFRLKGQGAASLRGGSLGDIEVTVVVQTPQGLSEKQKDLLKQFAQDYDQRAVDSEDSFLKKAKKIFS